MARTGVRIVLGLGVGAGLLVGCATAKPAAPPGSSLSAVPVESLQQQARTAIAARDWKAVLALHQELETRHPTDPEPPYWEGVAQLELGRDLPAIEALERSLAKKELPRARYNLGLARLRRGELSEASRQFQKLVAEDPRNGPGWHGLAQAEERAGNLKEAAAAVIQAKRLLPDDAEVDALAYRIAARIGSPQPAEAVKLAARGGAAMKQGHWEEAAEAFEAAVGLAPGYADALYDLGKVYRQLGAPEKSEQAYRKAIAAYGAAEPEARADAENNLADLLVWRNVKLTEAVVLAREAIKVRGERPSTLDTLARACDALGDAACARTAFTKLVGFGSVPREVLTYARKRLAVLGTVPAQAGSAPAGADGKP